jgi:hypothetical protein
MIKEAAEKYYVSAVFYAKRCGKAVAGQKRAAAK